MSRVLLATAEAHAEGVVPLGITIMFSALLIGLIACLALEEKLHAKKSIIAVVFALVCLFLANVFHLYEFVDHRFLIRLPPFDTSTKKTDPTPLVLCMSPILL